MLVGGRVNDMPAIFVQLNYVAFCHLAPIAGRQNPKPIMSSKR